MPQGYEQGRLASALLLGSIPKAFHVILVAPGPGMRVQVLGNVPGDKVAAFLRETADSIDELRASDNPTPAPE